MHTQVQTVQNQCDMMSGRTNEQQQQKQYRATGLTEGARGRKVDDASCLGCGAWEGGGGEGEGGGENPW